MQREVRLRGRTIRQFAAHCGVGVTTVRGWLAEGRLDAVNYENGLPHGRGGREPLLILILDEAPPARLVPVPRGR